MFSRGTFLVAGVLILGLAGCARPYATYEEAFGAAAAQHGRSDTKEGARAFEEMLGTLETFSGDQRQFLTGELKNAGDSDRQLLAMILLCDKVKGDALVELLQPVAEKGSNSGPALGFIALEQTGKGLDVLRNTLENDPRDEIAAAVPALASRYTLDQKLSLRAPLIRRAKAALADDDLDLPRLRMVSLMIKNGYRTQVLDEDDLKSLQAKVVSRGQALAKA